MNSRNDGTQGRSDIFLAVHCYVDGINHSCLAGAQVARLEEAEEYLLTGSFMGLPDKSTITGISVIIQMKIQMGDHRGALHFLNMALNMNLTKVIKIHQLQMVLIASFSLSANE